MVGGFASSINSLIEPSRTKFFFGDMIGYAKILYKNSRLKPKSYNVIVSQTLASNLIKYNILKNSVVNELMKKNNILQEKYEMLQLELKEQKQSIEDLLIKYGNQENNIKTIKRGLNPYYKFIKPFVKIKKLFIRK